jgi:protein-disulfide isomerase
LEVRQSGTPAKPGGDWIGLATLIAVIGVAAISIANWTLGRGAQKSVESRLAQVDSRIEQLGKKVEAAVAAARPARQGPDPDHVYTLKTEGAPVRGASNAPVTIVEISDFQ